MGNPNGLAKAKATLNKAKATHREASGLTKAEAAHGKPKLLGHPSSDTLLRTPLFGHPSSDAFVRTPLFGHLSSDKGSPRHRRHMGNPKGLTKAESTHGKPKTSLSF